MKIVKEIDFSVFGLDKITGDCVVCLPFRFSKNDVAKIKEKNSEWEVTFETKKKRRSLKANAYAWVLCDLIAQKVGSDRDTIHNEMLLRYGEFATYSIKSVAVETAIKNFDYYKILGTSMLNGEEYTHIRAVVGSHKYNSATMYKFIEGIIQEAKELDIETIPPNELQKMCFSKGVI